MHQPKSLHAAHAAAITQTSLGALLSMACGLSVACAGPPKSAPAPADPALDARGAALSKTMRCGVCHLPNYAGREQIPRIAGQREDFLVYSLKEFRDQPRAGADTNMAAAVYGISDADIMALAHYLARKP